MSTETIAAVLAAALREQSESGDYDAPYVDTEGIGGTVLDGRFDLDHLAAALEPVIRERERVAWGQGAAAGWRPESTGYKLHRGAITNPYDTKEDAP